MKLLHRSKSFKALLFLVLLTQWAGSSNADMVLMGTALKSFLMFPIVTVSLYVPDTNSKKDVLADIPKRLEVHYHVNVSKEELANQTIKGIERNFGSQGLLSLKDKINQINSYYSNIKAGDWISILYLPGKGSQVEVDGYIKGLVTGSDFARAFFSIWVGKNPVDERAKYKLLGIKS